MAIKIFIDQGHNPSNPNAGAEGNGLREQDIVYEIGVRAAALLNSNPNFEAKLSRNSQTEILGTTTAESLKMRVDAANAWNADAFVSIHANASAVKTASGIEGFCFFVPSDAYTLGGDMLEGISAETGFTNRGMSRRTNLYVLRKTQMPAVLLEIGFITNPEEAQLMKNSPELFANGIYNGILKYYSAN